MLLRNLYFIVCYGIAAVFLPAIISYYSTVSFAEAVDGIADRQFRIALVFLMVNGIFMVLRHLIESGGGYLFQNLEMKIKNASRTDVLDGVSREMLVLFEDDEWLARFERVIGISTAPADFISNGISFASQLVNIFFYYFYVYQYIGNRALLFLLVFVPSLIKSVFFSRLMTKARRKMNPILQMERKRFRLFLDVGVQSEGRIFRSEGFVYQKWHESVKQLHSMDVQNSYGAMALQLGMDLVMAVVAAVLLYGLVVLAGTGDVSIGVVIALVPYIRNIVSSADYAMNRLGSFYETVLEYREIKSFYADYARKDVGQVGRVQRLEEKTIQNQGQQDGCILEVSALDFAYPGSEREILHDINLKIYKGEKVAIVGENGAGKSTLLKILAGLYAVEDGHIRYDGEDINVLSDEERKRYIAFIFQHTLHYPASLKENLMPGKDGERLGGATEMLRNLDESLGVLLEEEHAVMVPGFRNSRNVSNGQWQKIAIARALMRDGSKLYFFDEPTAALDPIAEIEAFRLFLKGAEKKTMLIATHRLGLARKADRIIFLNRSEVEAVGTHEELMKDCADYKRMYESQASWYQGVNTDVL